ncbi:MAG: hypothetical protein ACE37B_22350 [Ilumatobacter sp.]|uniref:hypothetical protein n=1 Tax=Ilumatobacter sp. TaxID=1967498 RepID=UPI003919BDB7
MVGQHLFAMACDDVQDWYEPDSTVAATWPVIAGSFDLPDAVEDAECSAVITTLENATVDIDGSPIDIGSITLTNPSSGWTA